MKKTFSHLKPYKKQLVLGPLFKLFEAAFELIIPMIMITLIDSGIKQGDFSVIWRQGVFIIALAALGSVSAIVCQYYASIAGQGFGTTLRQALFEKTSNLSFSAMDSFGSATLVNRITNDVQHLQWAVAMAIRLAMRVPLLTIGGFIMAMTIDVQLSLILLAAIILLSAFAFIITRKTVKLYKDQQRQLDNVTLAAKENLSGVRVVRAFNREKEQLEQFEQENQGFYRAAMRVSRVSALLHPATTLAVNLAFVAILHFGGIYVDGGRLSQGQLTAYINYVSMIMAALIVLTNIINIFTRAYASAARIREVLAAPETQSQPSAAGFPPPQQSARAICFDNVSFAYLGDRQNALSGISFCADEGARIGIIGPTGSGKSTLINLLLGFYPPDSGKITVRGSDITDINREALLDNIAVAPQRAVLFSGTVRSNVLSGRPDASDAQVKLALDSAQCAFVYDRKGGIDCAVEEGGANFSGGQRQRLAIARALVKQSPFLVFDDSLSALDYLTYSNLMKAVRKAYGNITVITVTQRVSTIRGCDIILVMEHGKLAGSGTHAQLLKNCETYADIVHSQEK